MSKTKKKILTRMLDSGHKCEPDHTRTGKKGPSMLVVQVSKEVLASMAVHRGLEGNDPDYTKRDALWPSVQAGVATLIATTAKTLAECQAKAAVCLIYDSELLNSSVFRDLIALAA